MKPVILIAIFAGLTLNRGYGAEVHAPLPLPEKFTCADIARAANHFIGLSEGDAIAELEHLGDPPNDWVGGRNMRQQADWMINILFVSKDAEPEVTFSGGRYMFPFSTMNSRDWPVFPLAESEDVYFVLTQSETLAGSLLSLKSYFDAHKKTLKFRTKPLPIPTADEASVALDRLLSSVPWTKVSWKDPSTGAIDSEWEDITIGNLRAQTKIPANQSPEPMPAAGTPPARQESRLP